MRKIKKIFTNQKGFTLAEVLIAVLITSLGLLAYIGGNVKIGQTTSAAYEQTVAYQDMNRILEQMRDTAKTGTFPTNVTTSYPNNGTVSGFNNLTGETITVSYVSASADPLDVTLTTAWTSNGVRAVSKSLRTLITQRT